MTATRTRPNTSTWVCRVLLQTRLPASYPRSGTPLSVVFTLWLSRRPPRAAPVALGAAQEHAQAIVDVLPDAASAPPEVAVDDLPRRVLARDVALGASHPAGMEDRVQDHTDVGGAMLSRTIMFSHEQSIVRRSHVYTSIIF